MKIDLSFENADGYLLVRFKGTWTADSMTQAIHHINDTVRQRGYSRILWDCRGLSRPASETDRFFLGVDVADIIGDVLKIAVVYPAELITKVGETAAVNRSVRCIVLADIDEALRWLVNGPGTESRSPS